MTSRALMTAVVSGSRGCGKSTLLASLVHRIRQQGISVAGILAPAVVVDGHRVGYDLLDLGRNQTVPLARRIPREGAAGRPVPFDFFPEGLEAGRRALSPAGCAGARVIAVDEVGPLELAGQGWAPYLPALLKNSAARHVWVVRSRCLQRVITLWQLGDPLVVEAGNSSAHKRLVAFCLENSL